MHRWLRFSKYFKENDCNLTVYCPADAAWPVIDEKLNDEVASDITVIRRKIFEPHKYLGGSKGTGVGFTEAKKQSLFKKFIIWVRGNLFIPDSRVFWIKPSVRHLNKYLKAHPEIDTIISTGPPHSVHIIAQRLKRRHQLKWIADFRDPWTQIDFYEQLNLGERADAKQKKLEKECLQEADEVITISDACAEGLELIGNRKVHVITNGFEFPEFDESTIQLDNQFTITHFGSMPFARNPLVLWKAIESLQEDKHELLQNLQIKLIGTVDFKVIQSAEEHGAKSFIETVGPVDHNESIQLQRSSQLLLLVANNTGNVKGILTGKFFEYLGAKRPILSIGMKDSNLEKAIEHTSCGPFIDFDNVAKMKEALIQNYAAFKTNSLKSKSKNLDDYHSKKLAKQVIDLI